MDLISVIVPVYNVEKYLNECILSLINQTYKDILNADTEFPILDAALAYTYLGNDIHLVKENNHNIKITTAEDYYILKAMLELEENKYVFGM